MSGVRGVCDDVTCSFLHSGVVQVLKAGPVDTNDPFWCPNSPLQSSYIWFAGYWMWVLPASLAAACLSGSLWSTDRWRWVQRAVSVYSEGCPGWWCWKQSWSPQTGSLHKSLVCPDVGGCSAIPCWLCHSQTCLLGKQTAGGPARVQYCPSGGPTQVSQMTSSPQTLKQQVCSH